MRSRSSQQPLQRVCKFTLQYNNSRLNNVLGRVVARPLLPPCSIRGGSAQNPHASCNIHATSRGPYPPRWVCLANSPLPPRRLSLACWRLSFPSPLTPKINTHVERSP